MALPGAIDYDMPKFDMAKAKQLLEESGVPKDQWEISWVAYGGVDVLKNVALLFQANAGQLGIKVNIMQGDWGVMWDKQKNLETSFNVYPFRNWPDYATINPDATFHTQEHVSFNFSYYSNPQVDAWIEEGTANEAADKAKCYEAWQSAYKQVVADSAAMWIADTQRLVVHRADLEGIQTDAAYRRCSSTACTARTPDRRRNGPETGRTAWRVSSSSDLILMVGTLVGVLTVTFVLTHILPGSPVEMMLGHRPTQDQIEAAKHALGLDLPLWQQYLRFLGEAVRGDFGKSFLTNQTVLHDIGLRLMATLELTTLAMLCTLLIGVPIGVLSAVKANSMIDHVVRSLSVAGVALPAFLLGMLLQMMFYGWLGLLPLSGRMTGTVLLDQRLPRRDRSLSRRHPARLAIRSPSGMPRPTSCCRWSR